MKNQQQTLLEDAMRKDEKMLVRWLTKKLGDVDTARDVAQTVFMRVWAFAETQTIQNPRALIFKTASNLALNEMKRQNRFSRRHVFPHGPAENDPLKNVASRAPSPELQASLSEDVTLTLAAIRRLPARPQRAFVMNRFDGLSYKEIAKAMGVSESSVEKYMIEALKTLRHKLKPGMDDGEQVIPFPTAPAKRNDNK